MPRLAALLVLCLCAALPARAASEPPVSQFALGNGLQVVVIEDHGAPAVVHMVWYRVGAADEPPGRSGNAHFLEHLMFKGTETLDPGEFSARVARHGGSDNAFTSYDQTAYFQRIAADRLDMVMEMEADRMVNLRLDPQAVATERDVIIEERNQRVENKPGALFRERLNAALYLNHPYGTPIIGWRQEVAALDRADALDFYRRYYAPNNAILVVAGDVTPEKVRQLAEKHYGAIPANPDLPARTRPQEPPHLAARRLSLRDARVSQPYVTRAYLAPERDSGAQKQAAALTLLAEILGGGTTSVLAERLQFEQQIAVQTGAYYSGTARDDTSFTIYAVPRPGVTLQQAEAALDTALTGFLETGVDPEQLGRIKTQLRAALIYASDSPMQLANRYGRALTAGLNLEDVRRWPELLQAVTGDEIMAAARDTLNRNNSVTGHLTGPEVTQ